MPQTIATNYQPCNARNIHLLICLFIISIVREVRQKSEKYESIQNTIINNKIINNNNNKNNNDGKIF